MSRTLRYFRIAFTVVCGIVAVLLCVLWMRSYWCFDDLYVHTKLRSSRLISNYGELHFATELLPQSGDGEWVENWGIWRGDSLLLAILPPMPKYSALGFTLATTGNEGPGLAVGVPHWFPMVTFALLSAATRGTWLPFKRFSLGTLLIVMTAIAVVLGLVVWAVR